MAQEISKAFDNENQSLKKIEADTSFSLGQYGVRYKTAGQSENAVTCGAIQALEAATLSVTTTNWNESTSANPVAFSPVAVPAGVTIFGNFTAFTVTTGKVLAYLNA
jgi:hypothetical protein